ncbi:FMN-binding negative transcriptional regulator [Brevibacillus centrosporus]|uniref:Negative transcriptional regulator, PaiB family n=1 Tax=Brevibacillus centrosporus TaxID=54910 RepID=A0A1I3LG01_9BACL|nr:FMN-binding negative transcriptional regulator [Brevibacillus centrosporus]MED4906966.1 FMN-binding negative transcriptional regulator [Brevibacillus centrosporus]SFI83396.1 negative transcriptional regulator, PaiB family [Brevibacillus centrosporus]
MYTPAHFEVTQRDEMVAFMQQHPFSLLISAGGGEPEATHIPLEVEQRGEELYLTGHIARNNSIGDMLEQAEASVLAVFQGAHAYISSSWYSQPNVPTWNYMAVHAYGHARIVREQAKITEMMQALLIKYEQGQAAPVKWEAVPEKLMDGLLKGITCFEIKVERMDAKYKLSQNRSQQDRLAIISRLETGSEKEQEVAAAMRMIEQAQENRVFVTKTSQ